MKEKLIQNIERFCTSPLSTEPYKELRDRYSSGKINDQELIYQFDRLQIQRRTKGFTFKNNNLGKKHQQPID